MRYILCLLCITLSLAANASSGDSTKILTTKKVEPFYIRVQKIALQSRFQYAIDTIMQEWATIERSTDTVQSFFLNALGDYYRYLEQNETSIEHYQKALDQNHSYNISRAYSHMGMAAVLRNEGSYFESLDQLENAKNALGADTNHTNFVYLALNYGMTYGLIMDFEKSEKWLLRSLAAARLQENPGHTAPVLHNLASLYSEMKAHDKAIEALRGSLETSLKSQNPIALITAYNLMGYSFFELGRYKEAVQVLDSALEISQQTKLEIDQICHTKSALGAAYAMSGNYSSGIKYAREGMNCASDSINGYAVIACKGISHAMFQTKQTEKGIEWLKRAHKIELALNDQDRARDLAISQAEVEYSQRERETKLKTAAELLERENATQAASNQRNLFIIGFFLALMAVFAFWRVSRLQKRNSALIQREMDFQENLLHNIVHEFRTPLTLIQGPVEQLITPDMPMERRVLADIAKRNTERLLALVNQLLDMAKVKAGKLKPNLQQVALLPIFQNVVYTFQKGAEEKQIRLTLSSDVQNLYAETDPEMLYKILSNLVSNAVKFTPPGGSIELGLKKIDNGFQFSVSDTGIGIKPEEQSRIFEKFFQVDASITRRNEGTGIGLAYVQDILGLLSGRITLQSKPNEGTTFTVDVPSKTFEQSLEPQGQHVGDQHIKYLMAENQVDESPFVVLVEDNPDMRVYIRSLLSLKGFKVLEASNGAQGLEMVNETQPDVIISDVMMPEMDGFELCHRIKSDESTAHIPVILLTAKASQDSRNVGFERGADQYLGKPFNAQELLLVIGNMLNLKKQLQAKYQSEASSKGPKTLLQTDNKFLKKLINDIEQNLSVEGRTIDDLAAAMGLSRSQLHRRLKSETGMSATQFNNAVKMLLAKAMLEDQKLSVSETAYAVGFSDAGYFTKVFSEQFGITPSELKVRN